jgi:hypothetical protein
MSSVHDILDAIRHQAPEEPPANSKLEVRSGFYVYTGPTGDTSTLDHRLVREERIDLLARRSSARSD